jgi:hypothetical protein
VNPPAVPSSPIRTRVLWGVCTLFTPPEKNGFPGWSQVNVVLRLRNEFWISQKSYSPEIPAGASLGANLASVMSKSREIIQDVFDLQKPMPGSWVRSAFWTRHKSEIDKPTLVCSFCV